MAWMRGTPGRFCARLGRTVPAHDAERADRHAPYFGFFGDDSGGTRRRPERFVVDLGSSLSGLTVHRDGVCQGLRQVNRNQVTIQRFSQIVSLTLVFVMN
jgi:hypothetical protein